MSQAAGYAQLKEHAALVDALRQKYAEEENAQTVAAVEQLLAEASKASEDLQEDAKGLIQKLVQQNEETRSAAVYPEEESAHQQRLAKLTQNKNLAQQSLKSATDRLDQQQDYLTTEAQLLQSEQEDLHEITAVREPQAKYMLSLYMHVSRLNWRFGDENIISGTVSDPRTKDIRHFDIDTRYCTQFEAVQHIWDSISGPQAV